MPIVCSRDQAGPMSILVWPGWISKGYGRAWADEFQQREVGDAATAATSRDAVSNEQVSLLIARLSESKIKSFVEEEDAWADEFQQPQAGNAATAAASCDAVRTSRSVRPALQALGLLCQDTADLGVKCSVACHMCLC